MSAACQRWVTDVTPARAWSLRPRLERSLLAGGSAGRESTFRSISTGRLSEFGHEGLHACVFMLPKASRNALTDHVGALCRAERVEVRRSLRVKAVVTGCACPTLELRHSHHVHERMRPRPNVEIRPDQAQAVVRVPARPESLATRELNHGRKRCRSNLVSDRRREARKQIAQLDQVEPRFTLWQWLERRVELRVESRLGADRTDARIRNGERPTATKGARELHDAPCPHFPSVFEGHWLPDGGNHPVVRRGNEAPRATFSARERHDEAVQR